MYDETQREHPVIDWVLFSVYNISTDFKEERIMDNEARVKAVEEKLKDIFEIMGVPETDNTQKTPYRIAKMWVNEVFQNMNDEHLEELDNKMAFFPTEHATGRNGLIIVKDIPFTSMCEHHFMPFIGTVTVAYVPSTEIIGLSKIPRIVKYFSKRPQLQERFTEDIKNYLRDQLHPLALFVEVKATHTCVLCRGAEMEAETETLSWFGEDKYYDEFMSRR